MGDFFQKLRKATEAIDDVALAPGVDQGVRDNALHLLAGAIDKHLRRLLALDAQRNRASSPVSQRGGD